MFKVVIETDKGPIELRDGPITKPAEKVMHTLLLARTEVLTISVGGVEYEVAKEDFNLAVRPFLTFSSGPELVM